MTGRDLDVVLVGATGFVGRLTAAHLARHAPDRVRIGLAARSAERLAGVREELGVDWPTIVLDTSDERAVRDLAARTRVVATTVGPFLRHGMPLLAACAEAGTAYADLTGESEFVRRSIAAHHAAAERSGARIVHSCGFDSVPSDLGVGLRPHGPAGGPARSSRRSTRSLRQGRGQRRDGRLAAAAADRGPSDPGVRRVIGDPTRSPTARPPVAGSVGGRLRPPPRPRSGLAGALRDGPLQHPDRPADQLPDGWSYGPGMRYREVVDTGRGWGGRVTAAGIAVGQAALSARWGSRGPVGAGPGAARAGPGPERADPRERRSSRSM